MGKKQQAALAIFVVIFSAIAVRNYLRPRSTERFTDQTVIKDYHFIYGTADSARESTPIWSTPWPHEWEQKVARLADANVQVSNLINRGQTIEFDISPNRSGIRQSTIQINTLYYPGWKIFMDGNAIETVDLQTPSNPFGVLRIRTPSKTAHLKVVWSETPLRALSNMLSVIGILVILYSFRHRQFQQ